MLLSNIVLCIMPFFCVWCFYAGFKLGKKEKIAAVKIETPIKKKETRKKAKEQAEQLRQFNLLQRNIERYTGDSRGQTKL